MKAPPAPVSQLIHQASEALAAAGSDQARQEAEWLLACMAKVERFDLYLGEFRPKPEVVRRFHEGIALRCRGTPIQQVIGHVDFYGANFLTAPGVFIPRPETEQVVAAFLVALRGCRASAGGLKILELGVGSGCISCTLARLLDTCEIIGIDVSYDALRLAQKNAQRLGVASRIGWIQSDWDSALGGEFDCVVSNPPYIPSDQVAALPLEVRQEPLKALDGGADGMSGLLKLMTNAPRWLKSGGLLVFECGESQVAPLLLRAKSEDWIEEANAVHDLAGRPRGVLMRRKAE